MRTVIGLVLIALGVALGIYFGLWWAFIGGIVALIEIFKSTDPVSSMDVAWNIARVILSESIGFLAGIIPFIAGMVILKD